MLRLECMLLADRAFHDVHEGGAVVPNCGRRVCHLAQIYRLGCRDKVTVTAAIVPDLCTVSSPVQSIVILECKNSLDAMNIIQNDYFELLLEDWAPSRIFNRLDQHRSLWIHHRAERDCHHLKHVVEMMNMLRLHKRQAVGSV